MSKQEAQKYEFQAEIKQLLDLVIHSLYTDKEIFVRELVSNASDALEKLRHLQITEKSVRDDTLPLEINITTDDKAKTFTIQDTGIGMSREELVENLGTIAHSGSKAFLKALGEGGQKNANLIGQFGVGFYSAFMVAGRVKVYTRSWKEDSAGLVWSSDGSGSYEIEEVEDQQRGTKIVVELKDDCSEYSQEWRIRQIIERYSAFVSFPINLNGNKVNTIQALWLRSKNEISDEEYKEFYKFQAHAYDEPLMRLHFSADAPLQINALLFVPSENIEKFGMMRMEPSVALYCRKVMIDAHPKELLPEWLRFLKGVVDSEDLPLNISRETMQDSALVGKLNTVITKRFLKFLEEEAQKDSESWQKFYEQFAIFLKEGAAMDFAHKEQITRLLRFESSVGEKGKMTSFADYVSRMGSEQKEIYYIVGANRESIENGPYMEGFKARGIEVLYCTDAVDEYVMNSIREFDGKKLMAADSADVKLGELPDKPADGALEPGELEALSEWLKKELGENVESVSGSERLVDSPVLAVNADPMMTPHMRRMMRAMKQEAANTPVKVKLEINPRHPVIRHLNELRKDSPEKAALVAAQVLDNALIAAGLFEDPSKMISRLYKLLESV